MSSLITALALALALHGDDGVWALECVYSDGIELVYITGDHHEGERVACPVDSP